MTYFEVQCDGLVGPSHHYGGLSLGNVASKQHAHAVSHPKQAALQGLEKMEFVHSLGIRQMVIPPHIRPDLSPLGLTHEAAFADMPHLQARLTQAYDETPALLSQCYSAASMWVANMATVTPAPDARDGHLHLTPANLLSNAHRRLEAAQSHRLLHALFGGAAQVSVHPPLADSLPDEGAANHMRLCASHGQAGLNLFVYGKSEVDGSAPQPQHYPARQSLEACEEIAVRHGLDLNACVFIQQNPDAIDAGVFHNDVIAMSNAQAMLYHAGAFCGESAKITEIEGKAKKLGITPQLIRITEQELPLQDAVSSYFFNSQLLSLPDSQEMLLLAPSECEALDSTRTLIAALLADARNPITRVRYFDLRESMRNGGGPACLRLRVPMSETMWQQVNPKARFTPALHAQLRRFVEAHYPEQVFLSILADSRFAQDVAQLTGALHKELGCA